MAAAPVPALLFPRTIMTGSPKDNCWDGKGFLRPPTSPSLSPESLSVSGCKLLWVEVWLTISASFTRHIPREAGSRCGCTACREPFRVQRSAANGPGLQQRRDQAAPAPPPALVGPACDHRVCHRFWTYLQGPHFALAWADHQPVWTGPTPSPLPRPPSPQIHNTHPTCLHSCRPSTSAPVTTICCAYARASREMACSHGAVCRQTAPTSHALSA